ncbi:tetraspanin-6 isoform X1 [Octopus bimaculoides]|uniref:tetraspanin-6 isoform X1 n=1 Tax=Octopus bimaculoides TaxID=37653 RepID=UPI00071D7EEA|nr:tetraspanin-6 isoform X1 [Octopus bimaculoides]|eukprot:XP_014787132.1 PREDICTED: tetraspanin-6-like isoform X2 [Octopus bimaculoides]
MAQSVKSSLPYVEGDTTSVSKQGRSYKIILDQYRVKSYEATKASLKNLLWNLNLMYNARKMDYVESCGRSLIVILNLLLFLFSAIMVVVGCLVKYCSSVFNRYFTPIMDSVQRLATEEPAEHSLGNINIADIINEAATVAIVLGAALLIISVFGWCGACCKVRWMLAVYCGILTLLLATQITFLILLIVMRSKVDIALKEPLKETLKYKYQGITGKDTASISWNYIMNSLHCCGVYDFRDFNNSISWDRFYHDPKSRKTYKLKIPIVCCKLKGEYPNVQPPEDVSCALYPTRQTSNYHQGCYDKLWHTISTAEITMMAVLSLAAMFQMMLIFFSLYLIGKINKHERSEDS